MKLVVDRSVMLMNIGKAERMCVWSSIALMFKNFYADMYDDRFNSFRTFSNSEDVAFDVTSNIKNSLPSRGKVISSLSELHKYKNDIETIYVPINHLDNREGVDIKTAIEILKEFDRKDDSYLMFTSGCINSHGPTNDELSIYWNIFSHLVAGVSVGGSYYLQRTLPGFVKEVRIGEYMLFGTIPYCEKRELLGDNAILFTSEVIATFPNRKQILMRGGTSSINVKNSIVLSGGLEYSNASCDYTIFNDPLGRYSIGDTIEIIPGYNSLKLMRDVAREYKG